MPDTLGGSAIADEKARPADMVAALPRKALTLENEILQNAILGCGDITIIATDADGIIQVFNAGAERMLGYAASDVVDKMEPSNFHDLPEVIARADALSAEFATTVKPGFAALAFKASRGIVDNYELTNIRKDGSRFPATISITSLRDDENLIVGYLLIGIYNSTGQGAKDTAKREDVAHEMFRLAVDACPNGMLITDGDGKIVTANIEIEKQFGYRIEELIGQPIELLVPQRLRQQHCQSRMAFNRAPTMRSIGTRLNLVALHKNGTEFPVEIFLNPIKLSDVQLVLSMIVDVTERRRLDHMKDEFVATVSHELRTPLTSIAGALGLMAGDAAGKLPVIASRLVSIAYASSQRLVRLLNDILDIEKMELGNVAFDFKRIGVWPLIEQTIEENRAFAEGYDVRLRLDSASAAADVCADSSRLAQVVTNLLSNAIKFSSPGEEVVVAIETRGDIVRISVRDHGNGIPEEFKQRIFQKFAQADATNARQKSGSGLGLSIVKQIVDRLDGAVGFEDAPGGGTIFYVDLPVWTRAVERQSQLSERSHFRVLLCEDDPEVAIVLCERFIQDGFLADVAFTADDAIARVAAASYAAILVDLQLPEGDGIDLVRQLRAQPQVYNTLLVVLSTDLKQARDEDRRPTLLEILDWLETPIDIARLVRVFDRPIIRDRSKRPRVLHFDPDEKVLRTVAEALNVDAEVMSVRSIDEARRALAASRFDVAVLDVAQAAGSGFDLLHELRDREGDAIPLVVFSPKDENFAISSQVRTTLLKSRVSIDKLVATLRHRLMGNPSHSTDKDAA